MFKSFRRRIEQKLLNHDMATDDVQINAAWNIKETHVMT